MTTRIDILSEKKEEKEIKHYDFFEVMKEVKGAMAYWKAMGFTAVTKHFREEIKKL